MSSALRKRARALFFQSAMLGCSLPLALYAQEPAATQPPVLPDTEVEARQPTVQPQPFFDDSDLTGTILDGTVFDSPEAYGYRADSNTVGALIDVPDINLPATANVVTRDVLDDQQTLRIEDVLRNVPGAVSVGDPNFPDRFLLRGIEVQARNFRKDGFLDPTFVPRDFQNIERVEILKGPASILYGGMSPAGTVNLITKRAIDAQFTDVGYTFGSFQQQRYTLDTNGYASSSGNVMYRINGAYEDVDSFRDFNFNERGLFAGAMTWLVNDFTVVHANVEVHKDRRRGDHGIFPLNGDPFALPRTRYLGDPGIDFFKTDETRVSLWMDTDLSEYWSFNIGANGTFYGQNTSQTFAFLQSGPTEVQRARADFTSREHSDSLIANLVGDVDTGNINHKLLFGTEQVYLNSRSTGGTGFTAPLDAANPTYTNFPSGPQFLNLDAPLYDQVRNGFYFQDLAQLNENWYVLGGVRYDHLRLRFDRTLTSPTNLPPPFPPVFSQQFVNEDEFDVASPRGGIVYQPIPDILAFYFNYSKSFTPPGGLLSLDGSPVLPEFGELYEAGVKTELVNNLFLQIAGFRIDRTNVPFSTDMGGFLQTGQERAQGAEVSLFGDITPYWNIIANYAYTDTLLTDPNNPELIGGVQQRNTPFNSANVWTRYNAIDSDVHTVGGALGLVWIDERGADLERSVILPSYTRWDAGLYYFRGRLSASLYIENIFDIEYAASSIDESLFSGLPGVNVQPGAPVNARANITVIF